MSRPGYDILLQSAPFIANPRNVVNKFGSTANMQQGENRARRSARPTMRLLALFMLLKSAKSLGLVVPTSILIRADKAIE